jgi:hypothetical protein
LGSASNWPPTQTSAGPKKRGSSAPIHPKAMPVVLSPAEALMLQKPLAEDELVLLERE